jgi:hypothetical protein
MDAHVDRRQESQIAFGATLIVVGLILLGQRLGWGPAWTFAQLWPLLLIGMGSVRLVLDRGVRRAGYFWVLVGTIFLLDQQGVLALRDSWPLFIVWVGVSLLFPRHGCRAQEARRGD